MKKIKLILCAGMLFSIAQSCSDDFLEVEPKGQQVSSNYYKDEAEAYAGLVATYSSLRKNSGGFENMITMMNAASDDNYPGGGGPTDGLGIHSFGNFTIDANTIPGSFWSVHYQGIFRANILLLNLPKTVMDEAKKEKFAAEAKMLRALYYFNLVRMFKNVPLILEPLSPTTMYEVTQAAPEAVYAQIETDLTEAISKLPVVADEPGRMTQGAAKALLGKVYLYEGKNSQAAQILAEVNGTPGGTSQYGYKLLSNFADLWLTDNKFNTESILEVRHYDLGGSGWGNWGMDSDQGNSVNVMVGPRGYVKKSADAPDLPSGWSFNVFTQDFYDFIKNDPRFPATVLDLKTMQEQGKVEYIGGDQDTGYFLNKFTPRTSDISTGPGDAVLNYRQDTYVIRLADTYLMEAEALGATGSRAQALLDAVRARVGLASVPVSMQAIKDERRRELAGEGHRFFDLVRWGDAPSKLGSRGFVAGKNEILPIPYNELQNTKLVQNPGY